MNFETELWKHGNEIFVGITIMLSNTTCRKFPLIDLDLCHAMYVQCQTISAKLSEDELAVPQ